MEVPGVGISLTHDYLKRLLCNKSASAPGLCLWYLRSVVFPYLFHVFCRISPMPHSRLVGFSSAWASGQVAWGGSDSYVTKELSFLTTESLGSHQTMV
jgi:hypothetical protein